MKKFISVILTLSLLAIGALSLVACNEHTHTFGEEWVYDKNSHWHECTVEACTEVADKADHTWGESVVVTEPTPDSEGVSEKKCTVCGASENESVVFAGISEEKWNNMMSEEAFENYTLTTTGKMTQITSGSPIEVDLNSTVKIASGKITVSYYAGSDASELVSNTFEGEIAKAYITQYSLIFMMVLEEYESFEYIEETNTYKISKTITIDEDIPGFYTNGVSVHYFTVPGTIEIRNAEATLSDDGKLLSLVCDYSQTMHGEGYTASTSGVTTWTFSDYGTTVIE